MVLNSPVVVGVANLSADVCQYIACNPERFSSRRVLDLIFCFPFRHFSLSLLRSGPNSEDLDSYDYDSHSD